MSYQTLYNQIRPFKVVISNPTDRTCVAVFKSDELVSTFIARKIFIGKSPKCELTIKSGKHGNQYDGNTILLNINKNRYVFIGNEILMFTAFAKIKEYISPIGENNIPFPYAVDEKNNTYLLTEKVVLMNLTSPDYSNPYDYYYDNRNITSDESFKYSLDDEKPQRIIEFYINKGKHDLNYTPVDAYKEMAVNGKLYIVLENSQDKMISIDEEDFVKLMQKFGKYAKFRRLAYKRNQSIN
jgi:hypothetical protein